jgi:hypothetical protein
MPKEKIRYGFQKRIEDMRISPSEIRKKRRAYHASIKDIHTESKRSVFPSSGLNVPPKPSVRDSINESMKSILIKIGNMSLTGYSFDIDAVD